MSDWWSDLTDTVPRWLETLKSPNGLYRMSASAYHGESLDATTLAWDLHQMVGIPFTDDGQLYKMYDFIRSCQNRHSTFINPGSGLFQETFCEFEKWGADRLWEMSATYFGFQVAAIGCMLGWGVNTLHPFDFYRQFCKPGAISRYMADSMPWDTKPMGAGNMVDAAATMMRMNVAMGHHEYWHVINEMYTWLDEHQHGYHGFWGSHTAQGWDGVVQAGYHVLRGLHFHDGRKVHCTNQMKRAVLNCLAEPSAPRNACHYMDCAVLLRHLANEHGPELRVKVMAQTIIDSIEIMRREDGGFSFSAEGAIKSHNRYEVTPGLMESDLVGTVFYLQALRSALHVLGEEVAWGESATHGVRR